jgi:hypothetical protein
MLRNKQECKKVLGSKLLFLIFFIVLIKIVSAQQINPNEYLNELNNVGENCTTQDSFFYTDSNNDLSFISIYNCCSEMSCIQLPFDVENRRELSMTDLQESFNIDFTREAIKNGKLVPSNYFPDSVDVCSYFSNKLSEQSRDLAVKASDRAIEYEPENYQKIYYLIKEGGIATGFISEFDIGVFVVGVGCNGLSKQESEAFFKVGECYNNLQSIESGATYYGISSQTYNCMQEADGLLKNVINSLGQEIRGALNKVANTLVGIWDYGTNLARGNMSARVNIKETTYEAAKRVDSKLNLEKTYLENPFGSDLSEKAQMRFSEKRSVITTEYNLLEEGYLNGDNKVPGVFTEFIKNIFYEPDVYYNDSRFYLDQAKQSLENMKGLIQISKYNSAMLLNESISFNINKSLESFEIKSKVIQKFDYNVLIWIGIILIGIYGIYYFIKIQNKRR